MSMTEYTWAKDLLTSMGYEVNENNVTSILAWEYAEGGHFHNDARFNPLNTTRDSEKFGGRYDSVNSHGVASYPSHDVGLAKTVETLKLDAYDDVRHNLAKSAPPRTTLNSVVASPWGTTAIPAALVDRASGEVDKHPHVPKGGSGDSRDGADNGRRGNKPGKEHPAPSSKKIVLDLHIINSGMLL